MAKDKHINNAIAEATGAAEPDQGTGAKEPRKKREKYDRINLAFWPENYRYIYTMGRVSGEGMTAFVNKIIAQHREANGDLYEKAIAFKRALDDYEF